MTSEMASQITSVSFVRGIHRWSVDSPPKGLVTRKMFPFDDIIMQIYHFPAILDVDW